jgi:hypothetical protein
MLLDQSVEPIFGDGWWDVPGDQILDMGRCYRIPIGDIDQQIPRIDLYGIVLIYANQ